MSDLVQYSSRSGVGVIRIENPPVNALSRGVPEGILESLKAAEADSSVSAIVLIGGGRTFIAGADIHDFERTVAGQAPLPELHPLLAAIEDSRKPVVMAIHGTALGGGLEVAMAGHYRVATPDAQVGQPEVKLGLIPGAGGTQRLPRLAGVPLAAEMCALGDPLGAPRALEAGIVDRIVEGDLLEGAMAFAREAARNGTHTKTSERRAKLGTRESNAGALAALREQCRAKRRNLEAPLAAIDAVEIAIDTPFEEGLRKEGEIFRQCLYSHQSKGLIHAFFGERAVAKIPGISKDTPVYPIRTAAVAGAGTMGGGIAMAFANAGIPVRLKDTGQEALERGMAAVRRNYEASVERGRLTADAVNQRLALIRPQLTWDGFEQADIVVEAVFESLALKKQVFAELDRIAKPECVLATNTSTLDIDEIGAATSRPGMVIGTHFFSPANVMRLVEVVRGKATRDEVIATAMALAKTLKKVGVLVRNGFGFVGNRMMFPYMYEAQFLAEEGAAPERVDRVLTDFGMAMGIFAVDDMAGLDVAWRVRQEFRHLEKPGARRPWAADKLCEMGRFGQKTGRGWFRYDGGRKPLPDPETAALLGEVAREHGIPQREFTDQEILERCLYGMVNEGTRVLADGTAMRAVDIDVIYLTGYGFPAYRGGPMFWADAVGLRKIYDRIREFHRQHGERWAPAPLLERLAVEGKSFAGWDAERERVRAGT
jgi:3-hydroxyacyl-CoA dehydrogenase